MSDNQTINGAFQNNATTALKINNVSNNVINLNKLGSLLATTHGLNNVISNMYGVTAKWFRVVPQDRAKDVIFHEYTLYNNEECGFDINIMYTDSGYDEAALQYNMMGIQYSIPLTCEISVDAWNAATNNDGSIPQKNDVVYIPQSNKLYDVVSMNPVKTVASQITSYKCNLAIHKNKRSVLLNKDIEDTIDNYTDSVESIFGDDIKNDINDNVADKQLSAFNSTSKDKYKKLITNDVIISNDIISGGHILSNTIYKNSSSYDYLVKYLNSYNKISPCFISINFRFHNDNKLSTIKIDNALSKNNKTVYNCNHISNISGPITCIRGGLKIVGMYDAINNVIEVDNKLLEDLPTTWYKNNNILYDNNYISILSANNELDDVFDINVSTTGVYIKYSNQNINIPLSNKLINNEWYNISINIGDKSDVNIYHLSDNILKVEEYSFIINDKNIEGDYYIKGGDIDLSCIRLYNCNIYEKEKQLTNILSKYSDSESHMIIADNADIIQTYSYFGTQR